MMKRGQIPSISVRGHDSKGDVCGVSADDADGDHDQVVDIQFGDVDMPHWQHEFAGYMTVVRRTECRKQRRVEVAPKTESSHIWVKKGKVNHAPLERIADPLLTLVVIRPTQPSIPLG